MLRDILTGPDSWIKNTFALNKYGCSQHWNDACATKFCLLGAVYRDTKEVKSHNGNKIANQLGLLIQELFSDRVQPAIDGYYVNTGENWVAVFNNHPDTTWEDIQLLLELFEPLVEISRSEINYQDIPETIAV